MVKKDSTTARTGLHIAFLFTPTPTIPYLTRKNFAQTAPRHRAHESCGPAKSNRNDTATEWPLCPIVLKPTLHTGT